MQKFLARVTLSRTLLIGALLAVMVMPVFADSGRITWRDQSALLPYRDGVAVTLSAERAGQWLVSDGVHLAMFDGTNMKDLTSEIRARGLSTVSALASDGRHWMVVSTPTDRAASLWMTDGTVWNEVTSKFGQLAGEVDVKGAQGTWYVRTFTRATAYQPVSWSAFRWTGSADMAERVEIPTSVSSQKAGCFADPGGSKLCAGENGFYYMNGQWYFVGGSAELIGTDGRVMQSAAMKIWKVDGTTMQAVAELPSVKSVSQVWSSPKRLLIATSDASARPFVTDRLWMFDGASMYEVSNVASQVGLLNRDAREIRASWNGSTWLILAGKQLYRFDGRVMTDEGATRDLFYTVSSNASGATLFGGARSEMDRSTAIDPLEARLSLVQLSNDAKDVVIPGISADIISATEGPMITVTRSPSNAVIGDGNMFTYRVKAEDRNGVERIDIFVQGARVKSCDVATCEYTQAYSANGAVSRSIVLSARAVDGQGFARDTEKTTLKIERASRATAEALPTTPSAETSSLPSGLTWKRDEHVRIGWAEYSPTAKQVFTVTRPYTYAVAANAESGLSTVEIWVNGTVARRCALQGSKATNICAYSLVGSNYKLSAPIFVNANVIDARGKNTWTTGTWITVEPETSLSVTPAPQVVSAESFYTRGDFMPSASTIQRGQDIQYRTTSQNNTKSLQRVDLFVNGSVYRSCSFGAAVSAVLCEATVPTDVYAIGTNISFMSRAVATDGSEVWGGARSITIVSGNTQVTLPPTSSTNGASTWIWMSPSVDVLTEGQTASYYVGAWSPDDVARIDIVVDGAVRATCASASLGGNKECSYLVSTTDFSQGDLVSVNARVTDARGMVQWSEPKQIRIKRTWEPVPEPGPQLTIKTDRASYRAGERVTLTAQGWSQASVVQVEIYAQGKRVANCGADQCSWTSGALDSASLEYSARMVDRFQQDTWTPVFGMYKK